MDEKIADEIISCLPRGRTLYRYFRDRYALQLLLYRVGSGTRVDHLRRSDMARLLEKPIVREALRVSGDGVLRAGALRATWPEDHVSYRLTVSRWANRRMARYWRQTSRPGTNLVLQLNFCCKHNRRYEDLLRPVRRHGFECRSHPIAGGKERTLAWARIDVELDHGEALIEEVQTDWVRGAQEKRLNAVYLQSLARKDGNRVPEWWGFECPLEHVIRYCDEVLPPHQSMWDEAILSAALTFTREELGIRRIFFHTPESGIRLKGIDSKCPPPRSVYSALPKKFCFHKTVETPNFLRPIIRKRRKLREVRFHLLEL